MGPCNTCLEVNRYCPLSKVVCPRRADPPSPSPSVSVSESESFSIGPYGSLIQAMPYNPPPLMAGVVLVPTVGLVGEAQGAINQDDNEADRDALQFEVLLRWGFVDCRRCGRCI
jgi:hypothetical protein